jgi:uncharacterized membrane protein (UPF0182 family)
VRPADMLSAVGILSGLQTRWAHRLQVYVPNRAVFQRNTNPLTDECPAGDSSFPRRIGAGIALFFSVCLVIVIWAGLYVFKNRQRFFSRDPQVTADHYGARNLRLWQVILVWILAIDLLIMMLWRL